LVDRERHRDHLNVVAKSLGEQWTKGAIDQSRRENGLFRRATAALDEAAGDLAHRILALFIVADQGKKIDALSGVFGHGGPFLERRSLPCE